MLTMPTYVLDGEKVVKWSDVEVILSNIKKEMQDINTHGAKEFEQRFRTGWHDSKIVFNTEKKGIEKDEEQVSLSVLEKAAYEELFDLFNWYAKELPYSFSIMMREYEDHLRSKKKGLFPGWRCIKGFDTKIKSDIK